LKEKIFSISLLVSFAIEITVLLSLFLSKLVWYVSLVGARGSPGFQIQSWWTHFITQAEVTAQRINSFSEVLNEVRSFENKSQNEWSFSVDYRHSWAPPIMLSLAQGLRPEPSLGTTWSLQNCNFPTEAGTNLLSVSVNSLAIACLGLGQCFHFTLKTSAFSDQTMGSLIYSESYFTCKY